MSATIATIREKVRDLADHLPPDATWDDVMYQVALRRSIECGLTQSEAGETVAHEDIAKEFGLVE